MTLYWPVITTYATPKARHASDLIVLSHRIGFQNEMDCTRFAESFAYLFSSSDYVVPGAIPARSYLEALECANRIMTEYEKTLDKTENVW